jgi:hypothetical protein
VRSKIGKIAKIFGKIVEWWNPGEASNRPQMVLDGTGWRHCYEQELI